MNRIPENPWLTVRGFPVRSDSLLHLVKEKQKLNSVKVDKGKVQTECIFKCSYFESGGGRVGSFPFGFCPPPQYNNDPLMHEPFIYVVIAGTH